jgi:hypothetical protein
MNLQLPMQSVSIATDVVSSNLDEGENDMIGVKKRGPFKIKRKTNLLYRSINTCIQFTIIREMYKFLKYKTRLLVINFSEE